MVKEIKLNKAQMESIKLALECVNEALLVCHFDEINSILYFHDPAALIVLLNDQIDLYERLVYNLEFDNTIKVLGKQKDYQNYKKIIDQLASINNKAVESK